MGSTRRLLEEQLEVVAVLGSGKKSDAMWHVPHGYGKCGTIQYSYMENVVPFSMDMENMVPSSMAMGNVVPSSMAMENVVPFSIAMENVVTFSIPTSTFST